MNDMDPHKLLPLTALTYHVMLALADVARHGYGIIKEVAHRTDGRVELETGTLYTALQRMQDKQLIEAVPASERPANEDRRRRTYRLTPFGRIVLRAETERLTQLVGVAIQKRVISVQPSWGDVE